MTGKWLLDTESTVPSPSWEAYAERLAALLRAIADHLPGDVTWWDDLPTADVPLDPRNTTRVTELLVDNRLRNDLDEIVEDAGSNQWLTGRRVLPQGEATFVLKGGWGDDEFPVVVNLDVNEPAGSSLWAMPDEVTATLVAAIRGAIGSTRLRIAEHQLDSLIAKAALPFEVGSHVYMPVPLDDPGRFPPGARQLRCGEGWLLIVPPGASDEETVLRMRWVAAAIGAG